MVEGNSKLELLRKVHALKQRILDYILDHPGFTTDDPGVQELMREVLCVQKQATKFKPACDYDKGRLDYLLKLLKPAWAA